MMEPLALGRAAETPAYMFSGKDGITMRKLVALLIIGGMFVVGCGPSTPTPPKAGAPKSGKMDDKGKMDSDKGKMDSDKGKMDSDKGKTDDKKDDKKNDKKDDK
jgi:hypothetical protein